MAAPIASHALMRDCQVRLDVIVKLETESKHFHNPPLQPTVSSS